MELLWVRVLLAAVMVAGLLVFVTPADPEGLLAVPVLAGAGVLLVLVLVGARRGVVAARTARSGDG